MNDDEKRVTGVTGWSIRSSRQELDPGPPARPQRPAAGIMDDRRDSPLLEVHISLFAPEAEAANSTRCGVATQLLTMAGGNVDPAERAYLLAALDEQIQALRRRIDEGGVEAPGIRRRQTCLFCGRPGERTRPLVTGGGLLSPAICPDCATLVVETLAAGGHEAKP